MSKFLTVPLQGVQNQRFQILTGFVGSSDWWQAIFQSGACIAGGAAMFVADEVQCICNVGDIDVWMPRHVDMTPHVETLCKWLDDNQIDYRIRIQTHMFTVFNEIMNIQFISAIREKGIAAVLDGFDYDCVQAAIYLHVDKVLHSGTEISTLHLLCSERALEAYETRENKWINLRRWRFQKFLEQQPRISEERAKKREEKMRYKLFFKRGSNHAKTIVKHCCEKEHRIISQDYWKCITNAESQKFAECRESISKIYQPKTEEKMTEPLESDSDLLKQYYLFYLETLQLDKETFKTAKIQLDQVSENEWVLAPLTQDIARLNLEPLLKSWQSKFTNPTKNQHYAMRNLALLADPKQDLQNVKSSILSDGLKCNPGDQMYATGLFFDSQHFGATVHDLKILIERTFF